MKSYKFLLFIGCFECLLGYHESLLDHERLATLNKRNQLLKILSSPQYTRDTTSPLKKVIYSLMEVR